MNKREYIYKKVDRKALRQNVILMGDIIEDTYMANPDYHHTIFKIGFLNDQATIESALPDYLKNFDLVISGDGPLVPVNCILDYILDRQPIK